MSLLSKYILLERISLNETPLLYRAERCQDKLKVILKILESSNVTREEVIGFNKEYEIANQFSCKGIARYLELETYHNRQVAIIENFEGISLEKYLDERQLNIGSSLKIAIAITEVLEYLHQQNIAHQDLCPARFLIDPQTLEVKLIDFALASRVSLQSSTVEQPAFRKAALAYISPEQSGRIKAEIDIRSDLYSLGVILYKMVTGTVPFEAKEHLALIHHHIAKKPVPPHVRNEYIPVILSRVILKLLAKNASDRYLSPAGLKADLQTCFFQWNSHRTIKDFNLGQHDFSGKISNSKQFYGREKEKATLLQTFEQVASGAVGTVLIEGSSGIGKSALANQLKAPICLKEGIFISAKFNQFQRNIPYFGFIQAFKEFIDFVLTQNIEKITQWKERILESLAVNGKILTEVIPHLELLIGAQPPVPKLEPSETQNRFHYVFLNFIKCISRKEHPLVIFFDDLQWADAASLNLLKTITADKELQSFLFIAAYRDNEISSNTMFSTILEDMRKENCPIQKISLSPLQYKDVEALLYEILGGEVQGGHSLANLVYNKSQGNPLFVKAFLKCLYSEKILAFNFQTFNWQWNAAHIKQLQFTENIIELMAARIQKLPQITRELLKLAACLGYLFKVRLLEIVFEQNCQEMADILKPALDEDLILPVGDDYRFTHDHIQQAVYSLIPQTEKKEIHLKIGKTLLHNLGSEDNNSFIFETVNQLNAGADLIVSQKERYRLADLNLRMGVKAKNSAAYKPSSDYFQTGIQLLASDAWKSHYGLVLDLYTEGAESAFLSGNSDQMEPLVDVVLQNASNMLDKVRVYEIRIKSYTAQHKLLDAVQTSLQLLKLLNVHFPSKPNKIHVLAALLKIRLTLLGKSIEEIINLPLIKDPYAEAIIRVLANVGAGVYFTMPKLFPLFVAKAFYLMAKHGNSPYSGVVCASFSQIMIGGLGNINAGYRLGKIAMQMSEKFEAGSFKAQCIMMVNTFILPWKDSLDQIIEPLRKNYWYGLETGNIEFAAYSAIAYCYNSFYSGKNLREVSEEMEKYLERIERLRHKSSHHLLSIHTQAALNLIEPVENPTVLTGRVHNEPKMMQLYKEISADVAIFDVYLYKLMLAFIFGKYQEAQLNGTQARKRIQRALTTNYVVIFYFYETLTSLALASSSSKFLNKSLLQKASANIEKLRKFAYHNPSFSLHRQLLAEAEFNRVTNHPEKASQLYDSAIEEAQKNGYINDLALAYELAGQFYQAQHRGQLARYYLLHAYTYFGQWGALAKVRQLKKKYPYFFEEQLMNTNLTTFSMGSVNAGHSVSDLSVRESSQQLDLHSIMKAATAISSEVELDKLLKKLIKIAVENTGAQQGYLIFKKENEFFIEAAGSIDTEEEVVIQSVPIKGNFSVSEVIIQFAYLSKENLVIDNAMEHPHFCSDSVIKKKSCKSILCMPILHQGEIIGLFYFENHLITHAFTLERIEFLKLLSGQIAVSIMNALNEQKKVNAFIEREKLLRKINLQQNGISKAILKTQENERKRIAEELHDGLGYMLSTLKLNLTSIKERVGFEEQNRFIDNSFLLLERSFKELKYISNNLMPDLLFQFGLLVAVEDLCNKINDTGKLNISFKYFNLKKKFKKDYELEVFRIIQELINNTIKHAEAKNLEIQFLSQDETLMITVEDDGKGFDFTQKMKSKNKGKGLTNVTSRVNFLRGNIHVESSVGKGTTFIINLPLSAKLTIPLEEDKVAIHL